MAKATFCLQVKLQGNTVADIQGIPVETSGIPLDTIQRIYDAEALLERLFGHRFIVTMDGPDAVNLHNIGNAER